MWGENEWREEYRVRKEESVKKIRKHLNFFTKSDDINHVSFQKRFKKKKIYFKLKKLYVFRSF